MYVKDIAKVEIGHAPSSVNLLQPYQSADGYLGTVGREVIQ